MYVVMRLGTTVFYYRGNIGCGKPYSAFSSVYNVTAV